MKKIELVFIPIPGMGHLVSTVELAKLLIDLNERLWITVLIMKLPFDTKVSSYVSTLTNSSNSRIRFLDLKPEESSSPSTFSSKFMNDFINNQKDNVREILAEISNSVSSDLAGIVVDMFCTSLIDVANEFGVPSYVFFTSGAAMLGLVLHMQSLRDDFKEDVTEYKNSNVELAIPTYINPVPDKVLPSVIIEKDGGCDMILDHAQRYRETKGIIINTFLDLESHAIQALSNDKSVPPVYSVGPVLNLEGRSGNGQKNQETEMIMNWLDLQPDSSVVFLCFGSAGSFHGEQVKEVACALEQSGTRFLWSLRKPPSQGTVEFPKDYEDPEEILPQGFLQRTAEVGKVIGWAPQVAVLSHSAVGGFVSHCGWNSTLESIWCGVPMATWPLYAEQQVNAFLLVKDLGIAVEIKMDFRKDIRSESGEIVNADLIENGIRRLMDPEGEFRNKVKEMKEKSRITLNEGGSSLASLRCLLQDVMNNIP